MAAPPAGIVVSVQVTVCPAAAQPDGSTELSMATAPAGAKGRAVTTLAASAVPVFCTVTV